MVTEAAKKRNERRKMVLSVLKKCGTAHSNDIYQEMQKEAKVGSKEIGVTEQTIRNDLRELSGKKLPWGYKGKVKKIRGKLEWQYVEPKPPSFAAYGYRWKRDSVNWELKPGPNSMTGTNEEKKLEGRKKGKKAKPANFAEQVGLYLLHKGDQTVYVGRVQRAKDPKRGLYNRLREHTKDRLKHDWDEFSWFGFNKVEDGGTASSSEYVPPLIRDEKELLQMITTIEAVIINGIRPRANNRSGDLHDDLHYDQVPANK